ncbi:MAG: hypothetical protein QM492_07100 [Rhodobacterales bacterium]
MKLNNFWTFLPVPVWAPADDIGGGGGDDQNKGGDDDQNKGGDDQNKGGDDQNKGGDDNQNKGGDDQNKGGDDDQDKAPWYDKMEWKDPALKEALVKAGYHKGTTEEALERSMRHEAALTVKLGKNADALMDAPEKDGDIAAWLKTNSVALGIPEKAEDYDLTMPEMSNGMEIDDTLLDTFKAQMHEKGAPPHLVQLGLDMHAKAMSDMVGGMVANTTVQDAELNADLQKTWGTNWEANQQLAANTFQALSASVGLDAKDQGLLAGKMNDMMGDATLLKFFHGLSQMQGEDSIIIPAGNNNAVITVNDANARKEEIALDLKNPKTTARRQKELREERENLNKIIAG